MRILKYLKHTRTRGLTYEIGKTQQLVVYTDSDFASKEEGRRSVSGVAVMYAGAAVAWFSRAQRCVTTSTTESEYIAMGDGAREGLFVHQVLSFMDRGFKSTDFLILADNQGAIRLGTNPHSSARSRHIDIRHHWLRELIAQKKMRIDHVASELQHADVLTKPLETKAFRTHRDFLLNCGLRSIRF